MFRERRVRSRKRVSFSVDTSNKTTVCRHQGIRKSLLLDQDGRSRRRVSTSPTTTPRLKGRDTPDYLRTNRVGDVRRPYVYRSTGDRLDGHGPIIRCKRHLDEDPCMNLRRVIPRTSVSVCNNPLRRVDVVRRDGLRKGPRTPLLTDPGRRPVPPPTVNHEQVSTWRERCFFVPLLLSDRRVRPKSLL